MRNKDFVTICQLWDELSDFGADAVDEALRHCLGRLCRWLDADNAFWIGAVRLRGERARHDPLSGWRAAAVQVLHACDSDRERPKRSIKRLNEGDPGDTSCALAAQNGRFRVHSLRGGDLVDYDAFRRTAHYDRFYRTLGISDRIWVVFPVSPDAECYYCIDKYGKKRKFTEAEKELAGTALRGIKWFHRQLLLSHGLGIAEAPLTPTDRRVLQSLITGATEKAVSHRLGVTVGTAHQYILRVYRKLGVRSKAELLSLWLNRRV